MFKFIRLALCVMITSFITMPLMASDVESNLELTYYEFTSEKLPKSFNDYKIVQLSDFHNTLYDTSFEDSFIETIKAQNPNIIVLTGDMIDVEALDDINKPLKDLKTTVFMKQLKEVAPVYYIYGNNDYYKETKKQMEYESYLKEIGVVLLRDESLFIEKDNQKINLIGLNDPISLKDLASKESDRVKKQLEKAFSKADKSLYSILLAHRPEYIEAYSTYKPDLVLSGHTHGGQVKLNGKPLLIPGQDKDNPLYIDGLYDVFGTHMIINKGLGTSNIAIRLHCPMEIATITLKSAN